MPAPETALVLAKVPLQIGLSFEIEWISLRSNGGRIYRCSVESVEERSVAYRASHNKVLHTIEDRVDSEHYTGNWSGKRDEKRDSEGYARLIYEGPDMLKLLQERDQNENLVAHYTMGSDLEAMRKAGSYPMASLRKLPGTAVCVVLGALCAPAMSWAQEDDPMGSLTLAAKTMLEATACRSRAIYQHPTGVEMIGPRGYSADNGRSWKRLTVTPDFDSGLPRGYRREKLIPWLDPVEDRILLLVNSMDTPDVDPTIIEPMEALETYYLRYRVSVDGGKTYLFDEPIIQKGEEHSAAHPFEGIWTGKNAIFLGDAGNRPIRLRNGDVLVPTQASVLGDDGKLALPGGGYYWLETIVLIGTWREDGRLEWDVSERVTGNPDRTARGLYEGALAEMPDSRVLLVMRGSNAGNKDPDCQWPSHKWYSVSEDGGKHWTDPGPWVYSDGSPFFSPSSMSQLMRHSNGRVYWIGNLSPQNCRANHPRWPLVIGQVAPETLGLMRETVITIDTKQPDESDVNLSHWHAFEDRETGDIVIPMARHSARYESSQPVLYVVSVGE